MAYAREVDGIGRCLAMRVAATVAAAAARALSGRHGKIATLAAKLARQAARVGPSTFVFGAPKVAAARPSLLLVSHDLSASGAPRIVWELAQMMLAQGHAVTVASPFDGPFRERLVDAGATVILDSRLLAGGLRLLAELAQAFDAAICNTVVTAPAVRLLGPRLATFWYIHEVSLLAELLRSDRSVQQALALPRRVWAGSELSAQLIREHRPDVRVMPYGLDPLAADPAPANGHRLRLGVFASIEPRKGQDLAVAAVKLLPAKLRAQLSLSIFGRVLDQPFFERMRRDAESLPEIMIGGELDADSYRANLLACDAVLVPSRDDTLPLVSLDALGAGRVMMCTATTGTSAYLHDGRNGFTAAAAKAEAIAAMLSAAIERRAEWPAIGRAGRELFDRAFSKQAFSRAVLQELALAGSTADCRSTRR